MKKLALAASMIVLSAMGASAADLAARPYTKAPPMADPSYNWSGWYIGLNGGGSWDDSTGRLNSFTTAPPVADFTPVVTAGGTPMNLGAKHEGYFGGGQAGYNWQTGHFVYGLEADIQGADIGRTSTVVFPGIPGPAGFAPSVSTGRDHIDWFGTFRGRLGYAANNVLFYGTGGLAYGGVQSSATNIFTPAVSGVFTGSNSDTRAGWVAGAGIEWGFAPNWTVKGEYLHIDLGNTDVVIRDPVNFPLASATYRFHHELDTVRVGVNYKFGGPVVARY